MQALLLIGGWAEGRFVDWLVHASGRAELAAAIATALMALALWRIAVRNAREHAAVAAQMAEPAPGKDGEREGE